MEILLTFTGTQILYGMMGGLGLVYSLGVFTNVLPFDTKTSKMDRMIVTLLWIDYASSCIGSGSGL